MTYVTPAEFEDRMTDCAEEGIRDPELAHIHADELMCEVLTQLGYGKGIEMFNKVQRWYS